MTAPGSIPRILDASSNRAREGLRVMEDLARFTLNNAGLARKLKALRHELQQTLGSLPMPAGMLLASRDVSGDVGVSIKGENEFHRPDLPAVASAAAGRLAQALRSMEESAKVLGALKAARGLEAMRYRSYALHQELGLALGTGRGTQWRLCVLITEALCTHHGWEKVAKAAIKGGADCLQLREKTLSDRALLERAGKLVALARPRGVRVIINDRVDIALASGADGVHLGQDDLSVTQARGLCGTALLVGVSTANLAQARRAARAGADYCGVGPMFPTTTKHKPRISGPAYLRAYVQDELTSRVPHLAIGGISPANAAQLRAAGARGIAVSSAVCGAEDPERVCRKLAAIFAKVHS